MKSYFKFLSRNKAYTFINVAGLVVSLMFIILMGDYTWRQYSIDSWHKNADRIYLMGNESFFFMWPQEAKDIKNLCPEVEEACCVMSQSGKIKYGQQEVKDGENENGIIMLTDPVFFRFFDFELLEGDRRTALDSPDKCVITKRLAKRLFGDKNPIGESLQIVGDRHVSIGHDDPSDSTLLYRVSAVVEDLDRTVLPNETQIIVNIERFPQVLGYDLKGNVFAYGPTGANKVFLMLRPGMTLEHKKDIINAHLKKAHPAGWGDYKVSLTPLTDVLFALQNEGTGLQKGDKTRLYILLAAVLAILFFAVSNYINLTVANTGFRAKEMATRRLFGSSQAEISLKLIAESTLMIGVAFLLGFGLALCFQDDAVALFKGKIALLNDISIGTVSVCTGFTLLVGIISGILPSYQLSRYQPIDIVKGNFRYRSKMLLGKLFIVLQNVITVMMLTAALVIWLQLNHLIHAPLGFNSENLYYVYPPEGKEQAVRSQLEKMPFVERIGTLQGTSFTQYNTSAKGIKRDDGQYLILMVTELDKTAFELLGLKIRQDYGLHGGGYYLTEEALRQTGYTEKDRELDWGDGDKDPIEGVISDFHIINVLQDIRPFIIRLSDTKEYSNFLVKTNGDKQAKTAFIQMLKDAGVPEVAMEWAAFGMEESIADTFEDQQNTLKIITLFTIIAVIISVMGYVGMSLFFIRQRQKEIGIRKIMGSTSGEVMVLMLRIFCSPLLLSFVIAVPLSWYIMRDWLTNFSYRITLSPWIFAATCAFALLVAILSVGLQIIKAVRTNPVESIKTE
ncbi:MAG: FtsX-like permease family protein [Prevotella sp.]|nr:FtsX-like permease family protein [Prevotella sp.]